MSNQFKNPYFYVALSMIIGLVVLMWGVIQEGEYGDVPKIIVGAVLLAGGFGALITQAFGSGKKKIQ